MQARADGGLPGGRGPAHGLRAQAGHRPGGVAGGGEGGGGGGGGEKQKKIVLNY